MNEFPAVTGQKLVDQTIVSWNRATQWLNQINGLMVTLSLRHNQNLADPQDT